MPDLLIDAQALLTKSEISTLTFSWSPAKITTATSITDDPFGGMRSLKKLPANTAVMYLAQNSGWAYVEYNNGQDTPVRGFVPMDALEFTSNI